MSLMISARKLTSPGPTPSRRPRPSRAAEVLARVPAVLIQSLPTTSLIVLSLVGTTFGCNAEDAAVSAKTKQQYDKYCARCHNVGAANAPRRGDADSWKKRLRKGRPALLESVKKGLVAMPPMGDCKDCTDEDFQALIDYLAQ